MRPSFDCITFMISPFTGARPQLQFWINFCRVLRDWGDVQGLVIEWEDSYPLEVLRGHMYHQDYVYSRQEAARMTTVAEDCGLKVIPLCQTFGHLEYILKHYVHLREHPERPDCLTPIESFTDESFNVVTQLIDDVFNICPLAPAIHLGGDEVRQIFIFGLFLTHPLYASIDSTENQQKLPFF